MACSVLCLNRVNVWKIVIINISASWVWPVLFLEVLWQHAHVRTACSALTFLTVLTYISNILFDGLLHRQPGRDQRNPALFWAEEKWPILSSANIVRAMKILSNKRPSDRAKSLFISLCVVSLCLFMTSDCSLTQLWFFFLFFFLI